MLWKIVADCPARRVVTAIAPCALSLALAGVPARAGEGWNDFDGRQLDTVTATKTAHDPFAVAESVSIVDREDIESTQAANLADLLGDLPNVDVAGGPRAIGQRVVIRGLSDSRILFAIDGARQNYNRAHESRIFLDPELFKRVEVLRGPASALWGSGALGGVVSFTTVDAADFLAPGQTFGARLKGGYQDVNAQSARTRQSGAGRRDHQSERARRGTDRFRGGIHLRRAALVRRRVLRPDPER
ncbi:MAG: TonB-dependent receptor plug domain-containing protein [Candidatus Competibacteraceae bacterium]